MKVLLLGSGARESALAWKISQSPLLSHLYVYPGSVGLRPASERFTRVLLEHIDPKAQRVQLTDVEHLQKLAFWAQENGVELVICGPEAPLCEGLRDIMQRHGIPLFAPSKECAKLESSKAFAKDMMMQASIPTAAFQVFGSKEACEKEALEMLAREGACVIKADGLAAGKGVFICRNESDIFTATTRLYATMPQACQQLIVESVLEGSECSYFAWVHKKTFEFMGFARDYKCLLENNQGPNTGGMGCYTPLSWLAKDARLQVEDRVVKPLLSTLSKQGYEYTGFLYVGLMWTASGPQVLEFNIRLGDPECQALAVADDRDWLDVIVSLLGMGTQASGYVLGKNKELSLHKTICVVLASGCYPWAELEHHPELLADELLVSGDDVHIFTASVKENSGQDSYESSLLSGRGRVLSVVAKGASYKEARTKAYSRVEAIQAKAKGLQFRRDIALSEE